MTKEIFVIPKTKLVLILWTLSKKDTDKEYLKKKIKNKVAIQDVKNFILIK